MGLFLLRIPYAAGTALFTKTLEKIMTVLAQTQASLAWMVDVGVSKMDVQWLASIAGNTVQRNHPVTAKRVKEIQDKAYQGLLSTMHA